jgi:dephospho-CoA kinase
MLVVGLTGGIGAGKSSLAALLAERGAQVIDADALGRDALRPGRPAWHSVVDQFGEEILAPSTMEVDRRLLADIVFADRKKLAALNAIVHPVIFASIADALEKLRQTDAVVVLDAALLIETGLDEAVDVTVVVVAPPDVRMRRLQSNRGMTFDQIQSRMSAQNAPDEVKKRADIVVDNSGSLDDLVGEAVRVWKLLQELAER